MWWKILTNFKWENVAVQGGGNIFHSETEKGNL